METLSETKPAKKQRIPRTNSSAATTPVQPEIDPVEAYARAVISGEEIAGPYVRLACQRHLEDLEVGHERGLTWDRKSSDRALRFFPTILRLAGGDHEGKPFDLAPAQKFIVGSIFGWKGPDGFRRFRTAYIEMAKGNGKSPLAAGVGLYMLTADNEPRAEVYAAAAMKDQAYVLFRDAVAMVDQSIDLDSRITRSGGAGKEWNLAHLSSGSFFRPISSESKGRGKSGPRPHCAILDEVHEHKTPAMINYVGAGTKNRRQALILMITNSGEVDAGSVCFVNHNYSIDILEKRQENDTFFAYVCALDKGDKYHDRAVWKKPNPLLGISITVKYLEGQVREAQGMPSKESVVRRLNFCEWVGASDPWIGPEIWEKNSGVVVLERLIGKRCVGAIDLSKRHDLTALVLAFPSDEDFLEIEIEGELKRLPIIDVLVFAWIPEGEDGELAEREKRDGLPYRQWIEEGVLLTTPGAIIDYEFVAKKVAEIESKYEFQLMAFDHWHFEDMEKALDNKGVSLDVFDHPQGFPGMNPSIEAAEEILKNGRLRHGNNPLLTQCVFNVKAIRNAENLRMFEKRHATKRIDAAQSLVMALGVLETTDMEAGVSSSVID